VHSGVAAAISGLTIQHGNAASGGIDNSGTLTITNSTLTGNAAVAGGGVYSTGPATLTNVTVSGNTASSSGGDVMRVTGSFTLMNALIADNTAPSGPDASGNFASGSKNTIIVNGSGMTGLTDGANGNIVGSAGRPVNPLLGPLGDYGGNTQTIPLLPGSPAIDLGNITICNTTTGTAPVNGMDQRGVARPISPASGACDIGAFESRGFAIRASGTH